MTNIIPLSVLPAIQISETGTPPWSVPAMLPLEDAAALMAAASAWAQWRYEHPLEKRFLDLPLRLAPKSSD